MALREGPGALTAAPPSAARALAGKANIMGNSTRIII